MNAPKKPHRPSEPKKPEKSYTIARQYDIDLYDGLKFTQVIEQISKLGICYGDLFFRTESTGSYGDESICLSYSSLETITLQDAHFDKLMRAYEKKMETYKQKLASMNL